MIVTMTKMTTVYPVTAQHNDMAAGGITTVLIGMSVFINIIIFSIYIIWIFILCSNLNGKYYQTETREFNGIYWDGFLTLKQVKMMIRPKATWK